MAPVLGHLCVVWQFHVMSRYSQVSPFGLGDLGLAIADNRHLVGLESKSRERRHEANLAFIRNQMALRALNRLRPEGGHRSPRLTDDVAICGFSLGQHSAAYLGKANVEGKDDDAAYERPEHL